MNTSKNQIKEVFKMLFGQDKSTSVELDYSNIEEILGSITNLLGKSAYDNCLLVVKTYINQVDKSLKFPSKARFCIIWHFILEYCKQYDIKENATLGILLAAFILEYSKKYNISLKDVDVCIKNYNKEDGPFLSPEKWTIQDCEKTCISYYLRELYMTAMETAQNPFAISDDENYNFDVLERKNTIFMNLLIEQK